MTNGGRPLDPETVQPELAVPDLQVYTPRIMNPVLASLPRDACAEERGCWSYAGVSIHVAAENPRPATHRADIGWFEVRLGLD